MSVEKFLNNINIKVNDIKLVEQAFIHSSYVNEHRFSRGDNERLEFMGDAVLQFWISVRLYKLNPILKEGKMTTLRARLVCESSLANYARELELYQFLKLGLGEEKTGGRQRDSILADMFEALLGALYLDSGMDSVDIILSKVIDKHLNNLDEEIIVDYKTKLQEYVQADNRKTVTYELVSMVGPSNNPVFDVLVKIDDIVLGQGQGSSKKRAEQNAAKAAFLKMVR